MLGHPNFAHFVWNVFPGLYDAAQLGAGFDVLFYCDPLEAIAPFCAARSIPCRLQPSREAARGWQDRPTVLAGRIHCDAEAKWALLQTIGLDPAAPPRKTKAPCFYVTIRNKGRTMANQQPFLTRLIKTLDRAYPGCRFLIDGFSESGDLAREIYDDSLREWLGSRRSGGLAEARALLAALPARLQRG